MIIAFYLVVSGLIIAYYFVANPGYDFNTGCPYDDNNCAMDIKLKCYMGSLTLCFVSSAFVVFVIWLAIGIFCAIVGLICGNRIDPLS